MEHALGTPGAAMEWVRMRKDDRGAELFLLCSCLVLADALPDLGCRSHAA